MIGKLRYSLAFKILAGVVLLLALLSLFIGMIGYRGFTEAVLEQYVEGAFRTADSGSYRTICGKRRKDRGIRSGPFQHESAVQFSGGDLHLRDPAGSDGLRAYQVHFFDHK